MCACVMTYSKRQKRQPPVTLTCTQCGQVFTRKASDAREKAARNPSGHAFCSQECSVKHRWGEKRTILVECKQCGKSLEREANKVRTRGRYGPFCSHVCYGKWRTENLAGEASPAWKGGYSLDYGRSHWKRQRRLARERDAHKCRDCGTAEQSFGYKLDVHHVVPYDRFDDPAEANHLDNLVTLCRMCHTKRHTAMVAIPFR